jgi:hypothetical protein
MTTQTVAQSSATMDPRSANEGSPVKRGPKPKGTSSPRELYFVGDYKDGKPVLGQECKTEAEAQLHSLNNKKPYFVVQVWSVAPKLNGNRLEIEKSPFA